MGATALHMSGPIGGSSGSVNYTPPTPTAGNALLVACTGGGSSATDFSITDTAGNTWTVDVAYARGGGVVPSIKIWRCATPKGQTTTITCTTTGNSTDTPVMYYAEVQGTTGARDGTNSGSSTGTTQVTSQSAPAFTPSAGAFCFAVMVDDSGANPETITVASGGAWSDTFTTSHDLEETNGSSFWAGDCQYLPNAANAATQAKWTTGDGVNWAAGFTTLAASAATGGTYPAEAAVLLQQRAFQAGYFTGG